MADYKVVDTEKLESELTGMADEVRTLADTDSKMSLEVMTDNVAQANSKVDSQSEIIAQIKRTLQGKAGSGGGEIITITASSVNALEAFNIFSVFMNDNEKLCVFKNTKINFTVANGGIYYFIQRDSKGNISTSASAYARCRGGVVNFNCNVGENYDYVTSVGDTYEKEVLL